MSVAVLANVMAASDFGSVPTYEEVAREFAEPLERLVVGYEADEERRRDLLQEIHVGIWRGLRAFDGRASLRTWVYRVAHNVSVSHVIRRSRDRLHKWVSIDDDDDEIPALDDVARALEQRSEVERVAALMRELRPTDRQIILLYLEGFEHEEIGEICSISSENAATKVHRIKQAIVRALAKASRHEA